MTDTKNTDAATTAIALTEDLVERETLRHTLNYDDSPSLAQYRAFIAARGLTATREQILTAAHNIEEALASLDAEVRGAMFDCYAFDLELLPAAVEICAHRGSWLFCDVEAYRRALQKAFNDLERAS